MSFLIDPPILYAAGKAYGRGAPESAQGRTAQLAGAGAVAAIWSLAIPLYLDARWTRPMWRTLGAGSGRDLQVNSLVLRFDTRRPRPLAHLLAAVALATYPLWFWLGWDSGRRARPKPR